MIKCGADSHNDNAVMRIVRGYFFWLFSFRETCFGYIYLYNLVPSWITERSLIVLMTWNKILVRSMHVHDTCAQQRSCKEIK